MQEKYNNAYNTPIWPARLHIFEFEDQSWYPDFLRQILTKYLLFFESSSQVYHNAYAKLAQLLEGDEEFIDLCSGSGGPTLHFLEYCKANKIKPPNITLTDKFPSPNNTNTPGITYYSESVDARNVPEHLIGTRTLFTSFHHFQRNDASAILQNAINRNEKIAIFEFTNRTLVGLAIMTFIVPMYIYFVMLTLRPFSIQRILLTFVIPILPFTIWWDGVVSHLRTYTPKELSEIFTELDGAENYSIEAGVLPAFGQAPPVTYFVAKPNEPQV